jgi:transcriptional regulator with XRE-family HTH domain
LGGTKYPMIKSLLRQQTLGEFLRKHRELISEPNGETPAVGRRRRTQGLRREEVAQMAGISVTWYSRLEQGKEIAPSGDLLGRIANVLQLVPAERAYLFQLAARVDINEVSNLEDELVIGAIKSCLSSISSPAYMLDKYWTPLFWNTGFESLFSLWLNGPEINLLRHMFLDPNARTFVVDWELHARHLLAQFRIDFGKHIDDPKMFELVRGLHEESDFFRSVWKDQRALLRDEDEEAYNHPRFGLLKFSQTTFLAVANSTLKLVILTPRS